MGDKAVQVHQFNLVSEVFDDEEFDLEVPDSTKAMQRAMKF